MRVVKKPAGSAWVGLVYLPPESLKFSAWLRPIVDKPRGPTVVDVTETEVAWGSRCYAEAECDLMLDELQAFWSHRDEVLLPVARAAFRDVPGWRGWWNRLVFKLILEVRRGKTRQEL